MNFGATLLFLCFIFFKQILFAQSILSQSHRLQNPSKTSLESCTPLQTLTIVCTPPSADSKPIQTLEFKSHRGLYRLSSKEHFTKVVDGVEKPYLRCTYMAHDFEWASDYLHNGTAIANVGEPGVLTYLVQNSFFPGVRNSRIRVAQPPEINLEYEIQADRKTVLKKEDILIGVEMYTPDPSILEQDLDKTKPVPFVVGIQAYFSETDPVVFPRDQVYITGAKCQMQYQETKNADFKAFLSQAVTHNN